MDVMDSPDTLIQLAQGLAVTYIVKARFFAETYFELEKVRTACTNARTHARTA
jgi:hypothetical protein